MAGESIKKGNIKHQNALLEKKTLSREKIQEVQAMIVMGLDQKRCIGNFWGEISQKKTKLSQR